MLPDERPEGLDAPYVKPIINVMSRLNVWLYRASKGRLGGTWRVGAGYEKPAAVCLLTTIGKKSGQPRTTPLLYMQDGARVVIVASQGGMKNNPLWYGNLTANPEVSIQIGGETKAYRARTASADERTALWPRLNEVYADFQRYQKWTEREIPVVICDPT